LLRWHGGKWRLAPWIVGHFPRHRIYVEPFGGAASVLLRKPRSYAEVYNDLDDEVVNLFRILRKPNDAGELIRRLELTPFARTEFRAAYETSDDPIEAARRLVTRSFMGFGSDAPNVAHRTGFRSNSSRSHTTPALDWKNYPNQLRILIERLRGVIVESKQASAVLLHHDGPQTLHYIDPPYLPETRSRGRSSYAHEMSLNDHVRLLQIVRSLSGMAVLSGYPSPIYDGLLPDWKKHEKAALSDGAKRRTECLWLNPACIAALGVGPLWNAAA
jgi:DNA adenine methylase